MSVRLRIEGFDTYQVPEGGSLLEACEAVGVPMDSACGGFACCNSCRVEVLDDGAGLTPLVAEELPFLDAPDQRLGCQARLVGAVAIRLAPGA